MTELLTLDGYEQTKEKLLALEERLARLASRTDVETSHREEAKRSYDSMIAQYRRELKLYEASHPEATTSR